MPETETLGRFIRQTRLDRGMSLGQLANEVGRSSSSVRRWERDEVAPALGIVPALADALGVPADELEQRRPGIDGSDEEPVEEERLTHTTMEQPAVPATAPVDPGGSAASTSRLGFFGDLWQSVFDEKESWIGWARGAATAVILIIMLVVFLWAVGELFSALSEVWDSLDTN